MTEKFSLLLAATLAATAFAGEPAAGGAPAEAKAAPAVEAAGETSEARPEKPTPGPAPKEMKEYRSRLETLRKARDEKGLEVVKAEEGIGSRKEELAKENEDVGKLVAKVSELEAELAKAKAELDGFYAKDEKLQDLNKAKDAAEEARDAKQRELNGAVANAMRERMRAGEGAEGAPNFRKQMTPEERKAEWERRRAAHEARRAEAGKSATAAEPAPEQGK